MKMTATGLLSGLMTRGVSFSVQDDLLIVDAPKNSLQPSERDELKRLKPDIINTLSEATDEILFEYDERRAIAEVDGELSREEAEELARKRVLQPFFQPSGNLVIPFDSDPRYHWWKEGGMDLKTARELFKSNIGPWHVALRN